MQTNAVDEFVKNIENKKRRSDAETLIGILTRITKHEPKIWGDSMIGFDQYHYAYDSGRESDSFLAGFSPRKQHTVIYITNGCKEYPSLLERLGKHKSSVSCLYVNKLDDVNIDVLEELLSKSYSDMKLKDHSAPTRA
ncbi:DUF1801 domain-containing protein [Maritalea sp.]|uniref:DUF1801 domain-containing protein n=1 Tax=Maritalea sp. TaxID=2003361 RepID=UPI003EFA10CC